EVAEQRELFSIEAAASFDNNTGEEGEGSGGGVVVSGPRADGLQGCALQPDESGPQLFVGAPVHLSPHGAEKGVEGEPHHAVFRLTGYLKREHKFNVGILIERSRKAIAWRGAHAPPAPVGQREGAGVLLAGVGEAKERKQLQPPVQRHMAGSSLRV